MAGKILIGCKLPHGLQLAVTGSTQMVVLNGQNQNSLGKEYYVPLQPYGITEVDTDFWAKWKKENAGLVMVKNGFVFEAPTDKPAELAEKVKDTDKTGLEPINQADIKKDGVEIDTQGK